MQSRELGQLKVPVTDTDHVVGPQDAAVTIVEYVDFECPDCKRVASGVKMLIRRFGDHVRLVYRHFPIEQVHPHAVLAAEAAESAASQRRFWEMSDLLFQNQPRLDLDLLFSLAQSLGADMTPFRREMSTHMHLPRIRSQLEGGERSGVRGTPTFFVNGVLHDVSFGLRSLFDVVEAHLRRNEPSRAKWEQPLP
jgi:protein-disulfide isomerase